MSPLNRKKNLTECKTTALYRPWKGQLFIQNQRVCDLAFCSPFSGTIPAQLPAKLEAQYVVALRDLRRKLPEVAFGKNNYANDEVRSQGILFSLYEVETLNQNEQKVDQLLESLKEKDLIPLPASSPAGLHWCCLLSQPVSKSVSLNWRGSFLCRRWFHFQCRGLWSCRIQEPLYTFVFTQACKCISRQH